MSSQSASTRLGLGATEEGKVYRIEVTGYNSPDAIYQVPKIRYSNQVHLVPFNKLFQEYKRISKQGGVIVNVTPVEYSCEQETTD